MQLWVFMMFIKPIIELTNTHACMHMHAHTHTLTSVGQSQHIWRVQHEECIEDIDDLRVSESSTNSMLAPTGR